MSGRVHVVREGEWLDMIAHEYGFPNGAEIYEHEKNAKLRELRPDPKVIAPGDELWIPRCPYEVVLELTTAGKGKYKIECELPGKERLELTMRDASGSPMKNEPYTLKIGGYETQGKTDGSGKIEEEFDPKLLKFGKYLLEIAGQKLTLQLGHLDPATTVSGQAARLRNLGYDCGPEDGSEVVKFRRALRAFQRDQGLTPSGIANAASIQKLEEVYGK